MTHSDSNSISVGKAVSGRWVSVAIAVAWALVVAGGARVAFFLGGSMMTNVGAVGAWLMFTLGLGYAAVRLRPKVGGALLVGFGIGTVLVVIFGGTQLMS